MDAGWQMKENNELKDAWFEKRKDMFPHYGRDMEMLFSYVKIAHARRIYGKMTETRKHLTIEDIDKGYTMLLDNRKKENPISKAMLSMYI